MHELSLAVALVELACDEAARLGAPRIEAVHVRVGSLSGVAADALTFSFDAAAAGTPAEGARLRLEHTAGDTLELRALEIADR